MQRTVSVTEFKAKCLALLEEISTQGGTITIVKRGRPLATVRPARKPAWPSFMGVLKGKISPDHPLLDPNTTVDWGVPDDLSDIL